MSLIPCFADIPPHPLTLLTTEMLSVQGKDISIDSEGYLIHQEDWSEGVAQALADREGMVLSDQHWELIRFLRGYYQEYQAQPQVRTMTKYFTQRWGPDQGNNLYLHTLFPQGGPQKQGNRLAGLPPRLPRGPSEH
ncbi:tRNA 2-thiouridine synthesizing protein E [Gammaproteobacteria bacterium]